MGLQLKALLLAVLFTCGGCTVYHYADTCTRSQLLMRPLDQQFTLPPPPAQECEQTEWGHK